MYNTATNIPTFLRDFYSGDPVKKIAGTAEGLFEGLKGGFLDTVMPQRRAQMEATGMGGRRAQEALNPVSDKRDKDQSIRAGNIAASGTLKALGIQYTTHRRHWDTSGRVPFVTVG